MRAHWTAFFFGLAATLAVAAPESPSHNSTFLNPILPGWHSDPSCVFVDDTFFCVASTFISFPGLPIYASKNLLDWKLISHVWNRDSQIPNTREETQGQMQGMYAATMRHHEGYFYVVCEYLSLPGGNLGVLFNTTDPFTEQSWSDPVTFQVDAIDSDLFWDDDGTLWMATDGIELQKLDMYTGEVTEPVNIWNGTGGAYPEGPHIYKRDGWYYLLIAEGGTETNHAVTMARSRRITGPYDAYENNPVLTNRGTEEYFQTVGHADLFQDGDGNWWGVALSTRSGPEWEIYPMGRETVLFPVTWKEGEYPILDPVQGKMEGWPLPRGTGKDLPGTGPYNDAPDVYDFAAGSEIPANLVYWRVPTQGHFATTERGLRVVPSRNNVTGTPESAETPELTGQYGMSFIGRRQTDTMFRFDVNVDIELDAVGQEAGVTVFLTQLNHIDLGMVLLKEEKGGSGGGYRALRLRTTTDGNADPAPPTVIPVPEAWGSGPIRLSVDCVNATHYQFEAAPKGRPFQKKIVMGVESAGAVSGGSGPFTGTLVGVYATCNGAGKGLKCPEGGDAYFSKWRYKGKAQYVDHDVAVPSWLFNKW